MSLRDKFYNLKYPSAFSATEILKKKGGKEFLIGEEAYSLHKKYRKNYPRRKVVGLGLNYTTHADLGDFQSLAKFNGGYTMLLVVVDCYSRFVHVQPLKNKSGPVMLEAMEKVFEDMRKRYGFICSRMFTDRGTEFKCWQMQKLFSDNKVQHILTNNEIKCSMAERMIRTLKGRLYRAFTARNTNRWVDIIQKLATAINNSVNRSIKRTPASVKDGDIDESLDTSTPRRKEFKVGDTVRISKVRGVFDKGYLPSWSLELFIVKKVKDASHPPYLFLKDLNGEDIEGSFYYPEVQLVRDSGQYKIEKVLQKKMVRGKEMALIKWAGYSDAFNSWIPVKDIVKL